MGSTGDRTRPARAAQGSRAPTMTDVAAHVGVSRTLVSMVIRGAPGPSEQTRSKVLAAADELGFHPDIAARTLRGVASPRVGVLFDMAQPFQVEVVEQIYAAAAEREISVVVGPLTASRGQDVVLRELLGYRAQALVVIAPDVDLEALSDLSRRVRVPIVEVGRRSDVPGVGVVRSDDADGVEQSVDHLVSLGHTKIAHIDGGDRPGARERCSGYRQAMTRHGLGDRVVVVPGDYTEDAGFRAAQALLAADERPTAVVAGNDRAAVGVLDAARQGGYAVPGELSVVGFDDSFFARLTYIGLTTVRQDATLLAEHAVAVVAGNSDDPARSEHEHLLRPSLVVRESTGPAPR